MTSTDFPAPAGSMSEMTTDSPAHADPHSLKRWLSGDSAWFTLAAVLAAAVAAFGFALSFARIGAGARADGMHPWWLLPLSVDAPIAVFVIADHYLVSRGYRSLFARACAWGFAALTVALNVASPSSPLWHVARVAAPAAWILGIEAVRRMWKAHRLGRRPAADRAPFTEWAGAFSVTRKLWRRKLALGVAGWSDMRHLEEARLLLADLASAREDAGQPSPAAVSRAVTTGRLPAHVVAAVTTLPATEWEPLVTGWAARQMALPVTLLAAITSASPEPPAESLATPSRTPAASRAATPSRTPRKAAAKTPSRDDRPSGRNMTAEELAAYAWDHRKADEVPSVNAIMRLVRVSREKARDAHDILKLTHWAGDVAGHTSASP